MIDYKQAMITLFQRYYAPAGEEWQKKHMYTSEVDALFRGVIPHLPTSEHEVYEILDELGYHQERVILYEKICTFEGDEKEGIPPEYEDQEVGHVFKWVVFDMT